MHEGNDSELERLVAVHMILIGSGHGLLILMKNAFPINVLSRLKEVPEVVSIFRAIANPLEVLVAETGQQRAALGVVNGFKPESIGEGNIAERKQSPRTIGNKL